MARGLYNWTITIKNLANWIACGVASSNLAESMDYFAEYYHDKWLFTYHGYTLTPEDLDWKDSSFRFGVGEEVLFELDCDLRTLTATNNSTGRMFRISDIELPVCPVFITYDANDELTVEIMQ